MYLYDAKSGAVDIIQLAALCTDDEGLLGILYTHTLNIVGFADHLPTCQPANICWTASLTQSALMHSGRSKGDGAL